MILVVGDEQEKPALIKLLKKKHPDAKIIDSTDEFMFEIKEPIDLSDIEGLQEHRPTKKWYPFPSKRYISKTKEPPHYLVLQTKKNHGRQRK